MIIIILAGGEGRRLWPFSQMDYPKQFLKFGHKHSLLQRTVLRFSSADFVDELIISTNQNYEKLVKDQVESIKTDFRKTVLVEPAKRNTAPAIILALKFAEEKCQSDTVLVLPSDHVIDPIEKYLDSLRKVEPFASEVDSVIAFGIRPTKAETGYGYMTISKKAFPSLYQVEEFTEKPNLELAEKYVQNENAYWNLGMFLFSRSVFTKLLKTYAPKLFKYHCMSFEDLYRKFVLMQSISIDYALMEKLPKILMCPLTIKWSDVGSWDSVYEISSKDTNQNVKVGNVIDIDTKNSLIVANKRLISTIGMEDVLVVETKDALFLAKKGTSQSVKAIQKLLEQSRKSPKPTPLFEAKEYNVKKVTLSSREVFKFQSLYTSLFVFLKGEVEIDRHLFKPQGIFTLKKNTSIKIKNSKKTKAEFLVIEYHNEKAPSKSENSS